MEMNTVITISREYGSGGRDIGKLVAEKLDIPYYDQEITEIAAKMMNGNIACPLVIGLLKLFSFTSTNCSVVIVLLSCFSISSFSRLTISFESIFHGFV